MLNKSDCSISSEKPETLAKIALETKSLSLTLHDRLEDFLNSGEPKSENEPSPTAVKDTLAEINDTLYATRDNLKGAIHLFENLKDRIR